MTKHQHFEKLLRDLQNQFPEEGPPDEESRALIYSVFNVGYVAGMLDAEKIVLETKCCPGGPGLSAKRIRRELGSEAV